MRSTAPCQISLVLMSVKPVWTAPIYTIRIRTSPCEKVAPTRCVILPHWLPGPLQGPGYRSRRIFRRLLRSHGGEPRKIVTDKLKSYGVAHRELIPEAIHDTSQYANNRAELSHQPKRVRECGMRKFKSIQQAQRFLNVHAAVYNLFNLGRHLVSAKTYRFIRMRFFASWKNAVGI